MTSDETTPAPAPLDTFVSPRDAARLSFLDLMIPQLRAGGFTDLAARYAVERDRLASRRDAN